MLEVQLNAAAFDVKYNAFAECQFVFRVQLQGILQ
jgi:hypothetical protein